MINKKWPFLLAAVVVAGAGAAMTVVRAEDNMNDGYNVNAVNEPANVPANEPSIEPVNEPVANANDNAPGRRLGGLKNVNGTSAGARNGFGLLVNGTVTATDGTNITIKTDPGAAAAAVKIGDKVNLTDLTEVKNDISGVINANRPAPLTNGQTPPSQPKADAPRGFFGKIGDMFKNFFSKIK